MNKLFGILLLLNALAVIAGLFFNELDYWYIVDYCTIAITAIGGFLLLSEK